ncbi:Sensor protein ZraS [Pseudobythopirellula maris]|uniref:histidine kinase n=1 Tax=Pseudobythopirellula maris TaxID=2527991 RepID=A0A5C5ZI78_9BACT|nr:ATP-binding protein [Pseudobythopirellula maris]TWT86825.1 Sensor protein ZraS [Pseudobythopirellula maris]
MEPTPRNSPPQPPPRGDEPPTTQQTVQRLMDQYAEIARLAGGLAHEIKNPLSTIRLNMQLLAEDLLPDGWDENDEDARPLSPAELRARKRIEAVQRECARLHDLLDDFLVYAKTRRLTLEPRDLNVEIADTLDFFEPECEAAGIEIVPYLEADLPGVMLDREAFRGALMNLLINAKQAMQDGGQIVVQTRSHGSAVSVYLTDTGSGMDDATAGRMFEAFYSTKSGGSGLGLPTTLKLIEAHGGTIAVQSELGRGTRFTIELPAVARLAADGRG